VQKGRRTALAAFAVIEMALLLSALARPAYAYVDPGSGLLAIQVGGSMLAGALFVLRSKVRKLLRLAPPQPKPEAESDLHQDAQH